MDQLATRKSIATWVLVGLTSALLTIVAEDCVSRFFPANPIRDILTDFLVGLVFGSAIAVHLVVREQVRSIWRILSLLLASIAAYPVAVQVTLALFQIYPRSARPTGDSLDIPTAVFFGGGFCGSLIIFLAIVFLFIRTPIASRVWKQVVIYSAAGGLLGMLGWILASTLGRALLFAECSVHLIPWQTCRLGHDPLQPGHLSLFVVWQAGVGLLTGILLNVQKAPSANTAAEPAIPAVASGRNASILLRIVSFAFFLCAAAFLGSRAYITVRAARQVTQRNQAYKYSVAEAPSIKNLPIMQRVPPEQALILNDMGELFVTRPLVREMPAYDNVSGTPIPPSIEYSVAYRPTAEYQIGAAPGVRVWVTLFPNEEWARYKTRYPMGFNPALDDPKYLIEVTKSGNIIVMNTLMRYSNGGGALSYIWPSGNFVITIQYETRNTNEEFLTSYLKKYPSDLR